MDWKRDDRNEWNSGRRLKKKRLDEKLKQRVRATFRATGKVMGSQITQQVALQVTGNDTARAVNGGEKSWRWAVEKCGAQEWRIGC